MINFMDPLVFQKGLKATLCDTEYYREEYSTSSTSDSNTKGDSLVSTNLQVNILYAGGNMANFLGERHFDVLAGNYTDNITSITQPQTPHQSVRRAWAAAVYICLF